MGARQRIAVFGDDGFTLIEVVVSLSLTIAVMTATAGFFVHGLAATRLMQQRQSAVSAAQQAMELVRSRPIAQIDRLDLTESGTTNPAYRIANVDYVVRTVVNPCTVAPTGGECTTDPMAPGRTPMYKMVIDVTWKPGVGATCAGATNVCRYTVSSLRDPSPRSMGNVAESAR